MELFDTLMRPMNLQLFAADALEKAAPGARTLTPEALVGTTPNARGNDGGTGTKVQFTPEQQAAIDAIIRGTCEPGQPISGEGGTRSPCQGAGLRIR